MLNEKGDDEFLSLSFTHGKCMHLFWKISVVSLDSTKLIILYPPPLHFSFLPKMARFISRMFSLF